MLPRKGSCGQSPKYATQHGQSVYREHRRRSRRPYKIDGIICEAFIQWMGRQIRREKWSIDICVGHARETQLFMQEHIPCTKTLYNMLHKGKLPLSLFDDVPRVLKRKHRQKWVRKNKRLKRSCGFHCRRKINPPLLHHQNSRTQQCRYRNRHETTGRGLWHKEHFKDIIKTMTADNGLEFETLSRMEALGTIVYFTHPYSSWERAQNERQRPSAGIFAQRCFDRTG